MKKWLLLSMVILFSMNMPVLAEEKIPVVTSSKMQSVTMHEFEMLSNLVMAEAEDQSWEVQVYVACVVLNRVESERFPDSIEDVLYQKDPIQFTSMWNGRYEKVKASDSCMEAVQYALDEYRIPSDVLYFTSNGYLDNTEPYVKKDDMYFSKEVEK